MKTNTSLLIVLIAILFSCTKNNNDIPLPEHPRPNFERSVWQNLNGYWQFKPDSANVGLTENWQNEAEFFDQNILVPFSWASPASEVKLPDVNVGWYYRTFELEKPKHWDGNLEAFRLLVSFPAISAVGHALIKDNISFEIWDHGGKSPHLQVFDLPCKDFDKDKRMVQSIWLPFSMIIIMN